MNRFCGIVAGLVLAFSASAAAQPTAVQSELTFYRNSAVAIQSGTNTTWAFPGAALSSSTHMIYAYLLEPDDLLVARLLVVWTPGSNYQTTGARLISANWDLTNIQPVPNGTFQGTGLTPMVNSYDITLALRELIAAYKAAALGSISGCSSAAAVRRGRKSTVSSSRPCGASSPAVGVAVLGSSFSALGFKRHPDKQYRQHQRCRQQAEEAEGDGDEASDTHSGSIA